jgi:hypothetical protein
MNMRHETAAVLCCVRDGPEFTAWISNDGVDSTRAVHYTYIYLLRTNLRAYMSLFAQYSMQLHTDVVTVECRE